MFLWNMKYFQLMNIFNQFYEPIDENNYQLYSNEAKNIIKKYKNECNKNNTKSFNIIKDCDEKLESAKTHIHGGYECGNNE